MCASVLTSTTGVSGRAIKKTLFWIKTKLSVVDYTYLGVTYGLQESGENAHDIFRAVSYRHFIKCHNVWAYNVICCFLFVLFIFYKQQ